MVLFINVKLKKKPYFDQCVQKTIYRVVLQSLVFWFTDGNYCRENKQFRPKKLNFARPN